jgi:hypothetical protein
MLAKFGRWNIRDCYRLPAALVLWPIVANDYRLRRAMLRPDRWHWADALLFHWGYAVK